MYYKKRAGGIIIIIALIIAVLIGISIVIAIVFNASKIKKNKRSNIVKEEIQPTIKLTLNTEEKNQSEVIIAVDCETKDRLGIKEIILPDNSIVSSDKASFKVNKNGRYVFKVAGNNGTYAESQIDVKNIKEDIKVAKEPYIPEGFKHVENTTIDKGYIIKDKYNNEYVWVSATDLSTDREIATKEFKDSFQINQPLQNSIGIYGGFYIARYEASQATNQVGEKIAMSLPKRQPWTNVSALQASKASEEVAKKLGYKDVQTALITGGAWATTMKWIAKELPDYPTSTQYGNYSGKLNLTGTTSKDIIKGIADLAGNVREWTSELYVINNKQGSQPSQDEVLQGILRGGNSNSPNTPNKTTSYEQTKVDPYWGFRVILFKVR